MATVNPFALEHNLSFLVRSRNCCSISGRRTTQIFPNRKKKNRNGNFGNLMPFSWTRDSNPISEFTFDFSNKEDLYVDVGGLASFSSLLLLALPDSGRRLRPGGHRLRFSRPSLLPLRRSRLPSLWVRLMPQSDGLTNPQESNKTVRNVIKGRVQGVFYRDWTVENATQLRLKGWVRNRRDGFVEALFSGKPESVDEMQQRCRLGPPDAMVTGFQAFPCSDDPGSGFERKPTV